MNIKFKSLLKKKTILLEREQKSIKVQGYLRFSTTYVEHYCWFMSTVAGKLIHLDMHIDEQSPIKYNPIHFFFRVESYTLVECVYALGFLLDELECLI